MPRTRKPREIIDRKALLVRLREVVPPSGYDSTLRAEVLAVSKAVLEAGRTEVRRRFEQEQVSGREVTRSNAYLMDQLIRVLYDFAVKQVFPTRNRAVSEQMAVTAIGGYGRNELAPFSDIDLMFLLPVKKNGEIEQIVEFLLYMLWDLGLKVGHSTRSVDQAIRFASSDQVIRTSVLEARFLWGNEPLFSTFKQRFYSEIVSTTGRQFVEARLAARDERHEHMGDSRYVLEPNIKEGKGGLRDLQTLFWIAKYLYRVETVAGLVEQDVLSADDAARFAKGENFLWTVRCHLHYLAGRAEERLTFNVQGEIGQRMRYRDRKGSRGVERFMRHYFLVAKDVGDLTRIFCAVLEEEQKKRRFRLPWVSLLKGRITGFHIDGERLTVDRDDSFERDPLKLIRLFHEAQRHGLDIHPHALRLVTRSLGLINKALREDLEANRLFTEMLCDLPGPERALTRLNEAGVLGRFIPDFGRVVAQMQYDMYHVYTVDEHTIRAIGILHRIERGRLIEDHPVASEAIREIESRRALYVALLLHDIAKGRGGDHSELGAKVALKLSPRFGLNQWEVETVSWLVRYHLVMSDTAFKRDVSDSKTIADFVELVQSPERLRLLIILTVADIRAVGPNVWSSWKANLLRDLYYAAYALMTGGLPPAHRSMRVERAIAALEERLSDWSPDQIADHVTLGDANYWLSYDTDTHVHHARLIRTAKTRNLHLHIETRVDAQREATEIIIHAPDHPGLFAQIAGGMALGAANILDAKAATLTNGMALDTFLVQDALGNPVVEDHRLKKLWTAIEDSLSGKRFPKRELEEARKRALPSRTGVFKVPSRVLIDNQASNNFTVIEVNGRDRPSLLYDITRALKDLGLQIGSAHITTYGERAVDVFYVKDVYGLKIDREDKLGHIRRLILEAMWPGTKAA